MAYQNVGTPRFYVNVLEWLASNMKLTGYSGGGDTPIDYFDNHFRTLPVNVEPPFERIRYDIPAGVLNEKSFFAILGLSRTASSMTIPVGNGWEFVSNHQESSPIINCNNLGGQWYGDYDGFAIGSFPGAGYNDEGDFVYIPSIGMRFDDVSEIGSVVLGTYYDMPHSPDLKLTLTREYGGIKHIETKGGASLSNAFYTKPPAWGELGAWELSGQAPDGYVPTYTKELSRSGRRVWDLSFSYLDDGDVFGSNQSLARYEWTSQDVSVYGEDLGLTVHSVQNAFAYNILTDDNFYSQVIHKTNGGQLPFIFQPDSSDNTNFAICKLDMNSFKFDQVANGVYNMKLKIREVW